MNNDELASKFAAIATAIGVKPSDGSYHTGIFDNVPILVRILTVEPPSLFIMMRMTEPHHCKTDWVERIADQFEDTLIECELDGNLMNVSIYLASSVDGNVVAQILRSCITYHKQYFPTYANYCYSCRKSCDVMLFQSKSSIATLCQVCIDEKHAQKWQKQELLNEPRESLAALLPLAIILSALGWALFWTFFDWFTKGSGRSYIPLFIIWIPIVVVGYWLGSPVGKMLHKSGCSKYLTHKWTSIVTTAMTIIIGEIFITGYYVYKVTGSVNPLLIVGNVLSIASRGNITYMIFKLCFVVSLFIAISYTSKTKEARLDI